MDQKVQLGPLTLKNPVITASGTFGYGLEFMRYGDLSAIGAICLKGISLAPRAGNPMPRIAETPCGMLNAIGLQNVGVEKFLKEKLPYIPAGATLIANLYAQTPEDFGELAGIFATEDKIAALEVNISCPNVREGGVQFGQDPHMAAAVVGAVKKRSGSKPVIVKLSPNVTDVRVIAKAAVDAGADMLSLINTLSGMSVDIRTRRSRLANVVGGLSGPAIKPVALRMVHQVAQAVDVPIIGMGGITSAEDVLEFILVGAHAVQIGTYNFMRPDNAFRLVEEVRVLAESLGITSWDDYRGTLQV
ncbi:dihydroorotate oxidase B, catalytic subunit [Desulfomicrobium apsheronum]|uniref:Dihydroorotate dehydrogenase n=1 Tax=Desulfomicrobium apsheronum TaxID=52560 RepID=A0A1I3RBC6_9BACT|nr:dihydroorotate dehydrogenase [Desulfomicrobium apsheronum]SFJ42671.1 dihydroorotate oxidase B, catalytic subunit [Desulfomicrobium apsheronum]